MAGALGAISGSDPFTVIVVKVEIACQLVGGQRIWIAVVTFSLRRGQEADRHYLQDFGAEDGWRDDASAPDASALQQPGAPVARHQVLGLAGQAHR